METGIDKLILTTKDFAVKDISIFSQNRNIPQGKQESDLPVIFIENGHNGFTVQANGLGYNEVNGLYNTSINRVGIQVIFNPSKVLHQYELSDVNQAKKVVQAVQKNLNEKGIMLNMENATISRIDLAKQNFMERNNETYAPAFTFLKGKKMKAVQYDFGYRWGNKQHENTIYDKSIESKLQTPNLLRNEVKFKTTRSTQKTTGIHNLTQLYEAGTPYLTQVYNEYLNTKLFRNQIESQMVIDFDTEVQILSNFKNQGRNAVFNWLSVKGIEYFVKMGSLESIFKIMKEAGFTRQQIHKERTKVLGLLSASMDTTIIDVKTLISELKQTFAA